MFFNRKTILTYILPAIIVLVLPVNALPVPALQLDIEGGWYDWETETITTGQGEPFTLYALLTESSQTGLGDEYYLSVAVTTDDGGLQATDPSVGSFYIDTDLKDGTENGSTVDVTGDMVYGVPPLEEIPYLQGWDSGDLSRHGVFPTYFVEYGFMFDPTQTTTTYNTGYDHLNPAEPVVPGGMAGGGLDPAGNGSYYYAFYIDASDLPTDYNLHFDLYSTRISNLRSSAGSDIDRAVFAPFSHDAQTVPEPDILLLFGSGIFLAGIFIKRNRRKRGGTYTH